MRVWSVALDWLLLVIRQQRMGEDAWLASPLEPLPAVIPLRAPSAPRRMSR